MAALLLGAALGAASLTTVPAAQAAPAPHASVSIAGDKVLIKGTGLATKPSTTWEAKTVKFGDTAVDPGKVTALSATALVVEVPTAPTAP